MFNANVSKIVADSQKAISAYNEFLKAQAAGNAAFVASLSDKASEVLKAKTLSDLMAAQVEYAKHVQAHGVAQFKATQSFVEASFKA